MSSKRSILLFVMFAYIEHPTHYRFEGQDANERILLLLRAHPITNIPWILLAVIIFLIPFGLPFISKALLLIGIDIKVIPAPMLTAFLIINYLIVLIIVFEGFLNWYFNVYIVTNKNIVDVDFHSMLYKNIDVAPLRNIEDTSSSMGGLLSAIFHYGDVIIQTAGATKNIEFISVPRPHHVADFILDEAHKIYGKGRDAYHHPD